MLDKSILCPFSSSLFVYVNKVEGPRKTQLIHVDQNLTALFVMLFSSNFAKGLPLAALSIIVCGPGVPLKYT